MTRRRDSRVCSWSWLSVPMLIINERKWRWGCKRGRGKDAGANYVEVLSDYQFAVSRCTSRRCNLAFITPAFSLPGDASLEFNRLHFETTTKLIYAKFYPRWVHVTLVFSVSCLPASPPPASLSHQLCILASRETVLLLILGRRVCVNDPAIPTSAPVARTTTPIQSHISPARSHIIFIK